MRSYVLISLFALPLAAACVSSPPNQLPTGGETGEVSAAEKYFNENLKQVFQDNCASCHGNAANDATNAPDYLGTDGPDAFYDNITTYPDLVSCKVRDSMLFLKGQDPTHPGVPFPTASAAALDTWLRLEANNRGGVCDVDEPKPVGGEGGTDPGTGGSDPGEPTDAMPSTPMGFLEMFGECATWDDWLNTGMPLVANAQARSQNNNTECYNCHSNPLGENLMPDPGNDPANNEEVKAAFKFMKTPWGLLNLARIVMHPDGTFNDIGAANLWRDMGQPGLGHPTYNLDQDYKDSLDQWYALTKEHYDTALAAQKRCDPALGEPPP